MLSASRVAQTPEGKEVESHHEYWPTSPLRFVSMACSTHITIQNNSVYVSATSAKSSAASALDLEREPAYIDVAAVAAASGGAGVRRCCIVCITANRPLPTIIALAR